MKRLIWAFAVMLFAQSLLAQGPQTGFPPYGSFESGTFDSINRQDLNANFSVPIIASKGRGIDFNFAVSSNSSIWQVASSQWATAGAYSFGWNTQNVLGVVTNKTSTSTITCPPPPPPRPLTGNNQGTLYTYTNFAYTDQVGTRHPFNIIDTETLCNGNDTYAGHTGNATDGSGYFIDTKTYSGPAIIKDRSGNTIYLSNGILTDTNGNFISSSHPNGGETDWTDSRGYVELKIITGASSIQYEYPDPNGVYQTITLNLQNLNVKTNFGCSGVTEYSGTASLPSTIVFPNGLTYSFTYEATPGFPGDVTGRLSQVTLPNGGYVQYTYNGGNDGTNCTDGSALNLTRIINDGISSNTWQFVRTQSGSNWLATVTAPQMPYDAAANQTVFTFNSSGRETSRQIYKGSSSGGTLLRTINATWATNGSPATRTTILEDNSQSEVETSYDSNGNLLSLKEHDYASGAPGSILRTTTYTYLSTTQYTTLNILDRVTEKTVADSTGTIKYREDTAYDGTTINPCPTGVPQHNDTNFGCSFTTRGNPTSLTMYTNVICPLFPRTGSYDILLEFLRS